MKIRHKMPPRCPKDATRRLKKPSRPPKTPPRFPRDVPKTPSRRSKITPRRPQASPRGPQDAPRRSQDAPRRPRSRRISLTWGQDGMNIQLKSILMLTISKIINNIRKTQEKSTITHHGGRAQRASERSERSERSVQEL